MSKKHRADHDGFVYSTDSSFNFNFETGNVETPSPAVQKLRVRLETKHRAGKTVTVIEGFVGSSQDVEELCKKIEKIFAAQVVRLKIL